MRAAAERLERFVEDQTRAWGDLWCGGYIERSIRSMLEGRYELIEVPVGA